MATGSRRCAWPLFNVCPSLWPHTATWCSICLPHFHLLSSTLPGGAVLCWAWAWVVTFLLRHGMLLCRTHHGNRSSMSMCSGVKNCPHWELSLIPIKTLSTKRWSLLTTHCPPMTGVNPMKQKNLSSWNEDKGPTGCYHVARVLSLFVPTAIYMTPVNPALPLPVWDGGSELSGLRPSPRPSFHYLWLNQRCNKTMIWLKPPRSMVAELEIKPSNSEPLGLCPITCLGAHLEEGIV